MKVYLRTFGCRANHADSEAVRGALLAAGHDVVRSPELADWAVFNSCAVTADAEADLRQAVRRAARRAPHIRSIVMGCVSGMPDRDPALQALPTVSTLVRGGDVGAVTAAMGVAVAPLVRQSGTRALLRIQDGCDEHCTFCTTRLARGRNRSRPAEDLVREAGLLAASHPEIVLTGIHIGTYGADIDNSLGLLVERLLHEVPGVRFRLSSVEATEVDERLSDLLTAESGLAPFLHAPLQSGSASLLRRMGRHWYTPGEYAARVQTLVARAGAFGLGADVMTGFPGETDQDHAETVALCDALPFTYLHVFPFSPRPGTAAQRLPNPVSPERSRARAAELRALADRKAAAYRARRDGGSADVIVEGSAGRRLGLTEDYLSVTLADPALPRGHRFVGQLTAAAGGSLVAA